MKPLQLFFIGIGTFLLSIAAIAQPAERWVRVEYAQRSKVSPEAPALEPKKPVVNAILLAASNLSLYEEAFVPAQDAAAKPNESGTERVAPADLESPKKSIQDIKISSLPPLKKVYKSVDDHLLVFVLKSEYYWGCG